MIPAPVRGTRPHRSRLRAKTVLRLRARTPFVPASKPVYLLTRGPMEHAAPARGMDERSPAPAARDSRFDPRRLRPERFQRRDPPPATLRTPRRSTGSVCHVDGCHRGGRSGLIGESAGGKGARMLGKATVDRFLFEVFHSWVGHTSKAYSAYSVTGSTLEWLPPENGREGRTGFRCVTSGTHGGRDTWFEPAIAPFGDEVHVTDHRAGTTLSTGVMSDGSPQSADDPAKYQAARDMAVRLLVREFCTQTGEPAR